ncbi:TIGR03560 family F420-dependent LLM class oxidoreductase [Desertimonas flava]|uniref:TIGR03560 family F420-dependent LLM class oxidoreductase n=1 Tax=Desertimonas flava TaxID=2064846 RepID=UPI0013C4966B|nr:TIGR03560 family F420-dependent LLM class oxidoreductase [Desertimonas flava]
MARYAIKTPPHHITWTELLDLWRCADQLEVFESAWVWDHFYPLAEPWDGPNLEGWTILGALAQATSRLRIGSMVNGMHHRHPAVTANMAATLDHISGGRFALGMGAGWNFMESDAYGIPLGTLRERSDRFEEGIEVIASMLSQKETTFTGTWFQLEKAWCEPRPVQEHIPIVVGGKGKRRTLRTAARFADQWDMTFPTDPDDWLSHDAELRRHCDDVGRDQSTITRSIHLAFASGDDPSALRDHAAPFFESGVDVVIWSARDTVAPFAVEALANALT